MAAPRDAGAKPRIVIDCDPGYDDAIALLVAHRYADVLGITTVGGNAPLDATTDNALLVKALLGAAAPVHRGAAAPLAGAPLHAPEVHGESGLDGVARIAHGERADSDDAVGFLLDAPPDAWIVAVGPLTNLALAIERDPGWPQRIAGIAVMGGSAGSGNVTPCAEFNAFVDPEAAARVFAGGGRIVLCGLNLTRQLRSTDAVAARLRQRASRVALFAAQVFEQLHDRMEELIGQRSAPLHDPCAVLAATHPALIETQPRHVAVELDGALTRGMTVVDERNLPGRRPANVQVAYRIDAPAALSTVIGALEA